MDRLRAGLDIFVHPEPTGTLLRPPSQAFLHLENPGLFVLPLGPDPANESKTPDPRATFWRRRNIDRNIDSCMGGK